ncbi:class I SAM-dependent methyltransferase [Arenibaculum pallidiluteum]|uniref:class I SAM-dependent methyltransferase n=1 Tax=Arenibaculum pallidiluteum TaxID=2812559 RepID=UPI002E2D06B5|nr:class I SAM-dependent methyltransferase [Arenibaculum pallidiluteum]
MSSWIEFWGRPHAIYVNQRNLEAHFDRLASDIEPLLPDRADSRVLDWGCGDALCAGRLSARIGTLFLYDAVEAVRARLGQRLGDHPRIRVLDPGDLAALPDSSLDMILVVSVLQYLDAGQLSAAMRDWHRLLKPDGRLLIADVIEPDTPVLRDVLSQLRFARANGFLGAALLGLVRMALSDYGRVRRQAGFSTYRPDTMLGLLRGAGFAAERLPRNVGPTPHRNSFMARRAPASQDDRGAASPPKVQNRLAP